MCRGAGPGGLRAALLLCAIAAASVIFEKQLIAQLVDTLTEAGVDVPNWEPGVEWDDHVDRLFAAVRDHGLDH